MHNLSIRQLSIAVLISGVLAGCGGGSSTPAATTTTVSGTVMAGPFLSGQACAYKVVGGAKDALLGSCANLASSAFDIDIGNYTGDVLVEIAAGATYDDEANPNDNVTGTTMTGVMRTLINVGSVGASVDLAVTPLTETAIRLAGATLNDATVQAAIDQLAALLPTVTGLDLRTTLPATTTDTGLAYREALRALSQLQWAAGGSAAYTGGLDAYLTVLQGQIGSNGNTVGADLLAQINAGLDSNCSVSGGALSCTVSTGGGGGGGGGGSITCDTTLFQPGSVQTPTTNELASYALTYTGNWGSYGPNPGDPFVASGAATLVFNANGSATYNGDAYAPTSYCVENLNGGGQQLIIHGPANSHFDLRSDGTWNGVAPSGSIIVDAP